jgi:hypothetical protein
MAMTRSAASAAAARSTRATRQRTMERGADNGIGVDATVAGGAVIIIDA